MRALRVAAVLANLLLLALGAAILATKLLVPPVQFFWEDLSLALMVVASAVTVVSLQPHALFREELPPARAPVVAALLDLFFALALALSFTRAAGGFHPAMILPLTLVAAVLVLDFAALDALRTLRAGLRAPAWLFTVAGVLTAAWVALYAFPAEMAGLLFGVRPVG